MRAIFLIFVGSIITGVLTDALFGVAVFCVMTYITLPMLQAK